MGYVVMLSGTANIVFWISLLAICVVFAVWVSSIGDDEVDKVDDATIKRILGPLLIVCAISLPLSESWDMAKKYWLYQAVTSETADKAVNTLDKLLDRIDDRLDVMIQPSKNEK